MRGRSPMGQFGPPVETSAHLVESEKSLRTSLPEGRTARLRGLCSPATRPSALTCPTSCAGPRPRLVVRLPRGPVDSQAVTDISRALLERGVVDRPARAEVRQAAERERSTFIAANKPPHSACSADVERPEMSQSGRADACALAPRASESGLFASGLLGNEVRGRPVMRVPIRIQGR